MIWSIPKMNESIAQTETFFPQNNNWIPQSNIIFPKRKTRFTEKSRKGKNKIGGFENV